MYDPQLYQEKLTAVERCLRWSRDMMAVWGIPQPIDEISLLFDSAAELESYCTWASGPAGLEHFNGVSSDTMARQDRTGSFDVRFEFLRFPGADWRIEAMTVLQGEAPLHEKHLSLLGNGCIVHASFKLPSLDDYDDIADALMDGSLHRMAEYQNSYGIFSYWETLEALHYFKPRVNLRDC